MINRELMFELAEESRSVSKLMDRYWDEWEKFQHYAASVTGTLAMDLEDSKLARKAYSTQKKAARLDKYSRGWRSAFNAYRKGKDIDTAKLIGSLSKFNSVMQGVAKDVERVATQTMKTDLDLYKEVANEVQDMHRCLEKTHDLGEQISHMIKSE